MNLHQAMISPLRYLIERLGPSRKALSARELTALGRSAYGDQRYMTAYNCWRKASDAGEAEAAFLIGDLYARGHGVERNLAEAAGWYSRASDAGDFDASYRLATLLLSPGTEAQGGLSIGDEGDDGPGIDEVLYPLGRRLVANPQRSMRLLHRAARAGHVKSCALLGSFLLAGKYVECDEQSAFTCFQFAANAGNADGQFGLGDIYFRGLGVKADPEVAAKFYELAASQDHSRAFLALAHIYFHGQGRPVDRELAVEMLSRAADLDDADAAYRLGQIYRHGNDVRRDANAAESYFRKAASVGHSLACVALGELHAERGDNVQAIRWYEKATERKEPGALFMLGQCAATGSGMSVDLALAAKHFETAAETGHIEAAHNIGCFYLAGIGVTRDVERGRHWLETAAAAGLPASKAKIAGLLSVGDASKANKSAPEAEGAPPSVDTALRQAAAAGDVNAQFELGVHLCEGRGMPKDVVAGAAQFRKAAEQGHPIGCYNIGIMTLSGNGVDADAAVARRYLATAARMGHADAANVLRVLDDANAAERAAGSA